MTIAHGIDLPEAEIAAICRRYPVRELAVFGSAVQGVFQQLLSKQSKSFSLELDVPKHYNQLGALPRGRLTLEPGLVYSNGLRMQNGISV